MGVEKEHEIDGYDDYRDEKDPIVSCIGSSSVSKRNEQNKLPQNQVNVVFSFHLVGFECVAGRRTIQSLNIVCPFYLGL